MADGIRAATLRMFELAERERLPTFRAAERLAEERLAAVAKLGPRHWERRARERVHLRS
jgi:hypothetical protein